VSLPTPAPPVRAAVVAVRRVAVTAAFLVCVAGLGSVLAVSLANRAGYQVLGMKTGSMHPVIDPGDLVIAEPVRPADIRNGDVITFREPVGSHAPYTHRVVRTLYGPDGPEFTTKGDANPTPDLWTVHYAGDGWRLARVVRHAGVLLAFAQSPAGRRLVAGAVFVVTIALIGPVLAGRRREQEPPAGRHAAPAGVTA
jgi:signal peptidase I